MWENEKNELSIALLQILIAILSMTLGLLIFLSIGYKTGYDDAMKDKIEINNTLK